jgi:hypothetical protein
MAVTPGPGASRLTLVTTAPILPAWTWAQRWEHGRLLALVRLSARSVRAGGWSRAGRFYGWAIACGHGAISVFLRARGDLDGIAAVVPAALVSLSWAAGIVAWAAARDTGRDERDGGIVALAESRGAAPGERTHARLLATIKVVGRAVGFPGSVLAGLAFALSPTVRAAVVVGAVTCYAAVFGAVLGGLARGAARVSPKHGRALFAAVVLGPFMLRDTLPNASVVSLFSWLIERVPWLGGVA